jgi:predicted unusual protein kinase regulating ubiquinone biosynthesis (AarF/ABC1/UbiB family)
MGAEPERRDELDLAFQMRSAEDVVETLGEMKGALMKLGQLFSYVDDTMPEHIRSVLSQLQDSVPPMAPELAADVVRKELGSRPETLFRVWESMPIAAASIGQVHRAVLPDGTLVAVKVQYPGVADLMEADLAQLDLARFIAPAIWPQLDAAAVAAELRARLHEELDYSIEANNQRDFATWYADHPFIRVPRVIEEYTTARVLTTAFAKGERFADFESRDQTERDLGAEAIFRFVFRSIHDHQAFNGDPHPGNYLFGREGLVSFVDFGLVKRLPADARDDLIEAVRYVALDPDPVALRRVLEHVGHFPPGAPLTDDQIFQFSAMLWSYVAVDQPTTLTPEWASETVRRFLLKGPEFRHIDRWAALPTDLVILQRITVGLLAILARLNATANWHRILRELWLGEAPATPLGEREAEWLSVTRSIGSRSASPGDNYPRTSGPSLR